MTTSVMYHRTAIRYAVLQVCAIYLKRQMKSA